MKRILPLALLLTCLTGCSRSQAAYDASIMAALPAQDDKFARNYLELVRLKKYDDAWKLLTPELQAKATRQNLQQASKVLQQGPLTDLKLVGCNTNTLYDGSTPQITERLTYQGKSGKQWLTAELILDGKGDGSRVKGFHTNPLPAPMEEIFAFHLGGQSLKHYGFLAVMLLNFAFTLFTLVTCLRSTIRRKWLWALLCFAGLGRIGLNWTSGQFSLQLLTVQWYLGGVSAVSAGPYAPWLLFCIFPLGAITFWLRRPKLMEAAEA